MAIMAEPIVANVSLSSPWKYACWYQKLTLRIALILIIAGWDQWFTDATDDRMLVVDIANQLPVEDNMLWYGSPEIPLALQRCPADKCNEVAYGASYYPGSLNNPMIYWAELDRSNYFNRKGEIRRSDVLFSNVETIISDLVWPTAVVVDIAGSALYWVHVDVNAVGGSKANRPEHVTRIETSDLNGNGKDIIVPDSHGMKLTFGLVFDPLEKFLFWSDSYNRKIERINVDEGYGSIFTVLHDTSSTFDDIWWLSGLAIDLAEQKLYFTDQGLDTVKRINFDGTGLDTFYEVPMITENTSLFGIGIYGNDVFFGNWEWTTLFRKNKYDGLQPEAVTLRNSEDDSIVNLMTPAFIEFYQVDPEDTRCKPCCDIAMGTGSVLRIMPGTGSMLGGDILTISGLCSPGTNLKCQFDGANEVDGVLDGTDVLCVSPTIFKTGRIFVEISVDGGVMYDYQAYFTAVSAELFQTNPRVQRVAAEWSSNSGIYTINWDITLFAGRVTDVGIDVFAYTESSTVPELISIVTIHQQVRYSAGSWSFISPVPPSQTYRVGIIKVYDMTTGSLSGPALWSDVHSLEWLKPRGDCGSWTLNEQMHNSGFHSTRPACPCFLQQALTDFGRYTPLPACNMDANNCKDTPEYAMAQHCVFARQPSVDGAGQECCYDDINGNLIAVDPGNRNNPNNNLNGGGFAHSNHSDGVAPYNAIGTVPYLSHFLNDLEPRLQCCIFPATPMFCYRYKEVRPSQTDCNLYSEPTAGVGAGDPHLLTLDGTSYTFNGKGEYVMLETDFVESEKFVLQGRTDTIANADFPATVFIAFAAQYGLSDIIHVEISRSRHLSVWVRSHQEETWNNINLEESNWWNLQGVALYARNIVENGMLVLFDRGVSLEIRSTNGENRVMSVIFLGPESFQGHTTGLLGTWNDNPDDDFLTRTGAVVSIDASTQDIHEQFGQTWQITDAESRFYYRPTYDASSYRDESFMPVYDLPSNEDVLPEDAEDACDGNEWCIFDYLTIGDVKVAMASKATFEEQEALVEASKNVILCSSLTSPENGNVFVTRTSVGGLATYYCDEGYMLMGMERRVCQQTGRWFGRTPTCTEIPIIGPSSFSLGQSVHLVLENEESIELSIRRQGDTRVAGSIRLATQTTSEGGASTTTDYQSHTELLTFNEGIDEINRLIYIQDDDIREELESFEIRLSDPVSSDLGMPDMATVFIEDDEVEHFFRETAYSVSENATSVRLTIQKVGYMGRTTVNFLTRDGSAKSPVDYISKRGTLVFEQDLNTAYIDISIINDNTYEAPEQLYVSLQSSTTGQVGSRDEAVVNIGNDDELCPAPCANGGECTDTDTCTCSSPAFYGRYCEKDSCLPPCENGGKCTAFRTCDCAEGYQGNRCQYPICIPSCENGGTCIAPNTCSCPPDVTGSTCTTTVCSPPCLNRGTCNELHTCTCPFMFTGDQCELLATNDCLTPNLCGGEEFRCIETMASYMCRCAFGYYAVDDQCILASRVIVAEMSIVELDQMSISYENPLMYPGSREFADLENTFIPVVSNILRFAATGFIEAKIRTVRMGSIRVEFEVLLSEQTTSGSQDVLEALQRSTTPRGILAGTNIKVDPFFTTIISELCPADYCEDNMICRPDAINYISVCVCDEAALGEECPDNGSSAQEDGDDDDFSVAGIVGLGIVLFILLVALAVVILWCHRLRRSRLNRMNAQRMSVAHLYAHEAFQLQNMYWNAGEPYVYNIPQQGGDANYWGL